MSKEDWDRIEEDYKQQIIDGDVILDPWCTDDVQYRFEDMYTDGKQLVLTEEQKRDVLQLCMKNHDAEIGINWYSIDAAIDEVLEE